MATDVAKRNDRKSRLTTGPHDLARRQWADDVIRDLLDNPQVCSGDLGTLVANAAANARAMAAAARDSKDDDLFKQ